MTRLWTKKWACMWAAAVVMAAGVIAHAAQTLRIVPIVRDDHVLVDKAIVGTTDRYDNLTRRHTLTRTVDGRETESTTTESEAVVRQWLTTLDKLPICRTTKLDPNRDYYVQVSARVMPDKTSMLGLPNAIVGRSPFTFIP